MSSGGSKLVRLVMIQSLGLNKVPLVVVSSPF